MKIRNIKLLICTIFILLLSSSLFAVEEYISDIYKQIDHIFIIKSEKDLDKVLSNNNSDRYYYLIENYTEKKIRRLIVNNDYDFAMTAIVIVIENNLDNEQAVEMYSVIADAYAIQQEYAAEQEQKRQLEIVRIQMEKEKQRDSVNKEFVAATNETTGKSVYVSGKETKLSKAYWKAALGMINVMDLYDAASGFNSFHYGISADYRYEYGLENKNVIGTDIFTAVRFLAIAESENNVPLTGHVEGLIKFAPAAISKDLFFRLGGGIILTGKSDLAVNTKETADSMITPIAGIRMQNIAVGNNKFEIGADWYAGHLFYENIKFAAGVNTNVAFPFAELEKVRLNLNVGVRDTIMLKSNGIENRASIIFAIGGENVIR